MGQATLEATVSGTRHELHSLAGCYVEFCADHLLQLEELISRQDTALVSKAARALCGNAGHMGLSELSSLGRQLEEYCVEPDWEAVAYTYRAIADTVMHLCETAPVRVPFVVEAPTPPMSIRVMRTG